jgi:hypothetical protein
MEFGERTFRGKLHRINTSYTLTNCSKIWSSTFSPFLLRQYRNPNFTSAIESDAGTSVTDFGLCSRDSTGPLYVTEMFPESLEPHFEALEVAIGNDENFKSSAKAATFAFGLRSGESDETLIVSVDGDRAKLSLAQSPTPAFTLSARANDWEQFLAPIPKAPFQS